MGLPVFVLYYPLWEFLATTKEQVLAVATAAVFLRTKSSLDHQRRARARPNDLVPHQLGTHNIDVPSNRCAYGTYELRHVERRRTARLLQHNARDAFALERGDRELAHAASRVGVGALALLMQVTASQILYEKDSHEM